MQSPCIGLCLLDRDGRCEGCLRTGAEIAGWLSMTPAEREHLMAVVLPQREKERP
ncbi:NUDIX hydrolase [Dokdonella koreensis DS-123]|uniref:NUDIX hydrolase n=1 Tax=Dokdonella koreensis DS-123 TaxID=1300342 RepID=A0A160DVY9_9GAMM|nr:NUDIX hydrolase [Dokdonella koreensis DS-123]